MCPQYFKKFSESMNRKCFLMIFFNVMHSLYYISRTLRNIHRIVLYSSITEKKNLLDKTLISRRRKQEEVIWLLSFIHLPDHIKSKLIIELVKDFTIYELQPFNSN